MRINLGFFSFEIGGKKKKNNENVTGSSGRMLTEEEIKERMNNMTISMAEAKDMSESIGAFEKAKVDEATQNALSEKLANRINEEKPTNSFALSQIVTEVFNEFNVPIKEKMASFWADSFMESYFYEENR